MPAKKKHFLSNVGEVNGRWQADCSYCGMRVGLQVNIYGGYYCNSQRKKAMPKAKERVRAHGLTDSEANAMKRGASCSICSRVDRLAIDHDHATGYVRGVLCIECNLGIGQFKDSPDRLRSAAKYLERANDAYTGRNH